MLLLAANAVVEPPIVNQPIVEPPIVNQPIVEPTIAAPIIHIIPPMDPPAVEPALAPAIIPIIALEPAHASAPAILEIGATTIHPIEPVPRAPFSGLIPQFKQDKRRPEVWVCYNPQRQIIPNAVVPLDLPKGITESITLSSLGNNRHSFFAVRYNNHHLRYTYGGRSGYNRENAYMEAALCLRHLLVKFIYTIDHSMERNTAWYDTLDNLLDDLDNRASNQPLQLARLNSTSTTATTLGSHSPLVIHDYDDNDNYDFGAYDMDAPLQGSSMDIEPLIVDFENDFI